MVDRMILISTWIAGHDGRGLTWGAIAKHDGRVFTVDGVYQPVRDVLRAVIDGTPDFTDCGWQLERHGRIDLSGPSARKMAATTVSESAGGTRFARDRPPLASIYAPPGASEGEGTTEEETP